MAQAENEAWEAKLQLNSRASYIAAGNVAETVEAEAMQEEEEAEIIKDEPLDSPPPQPKAMPMTVSPVMEVFTKLLGGFCIPCKQQLTASA